MTAPIFIVGANRSGTTLLRLILNAHSQVAIPDEINYFYSFWGKAGYDHWWAPSLTADDYVAFVDDFLQKNQAITPELDMETLRADILTGPHDLRRPYQLLLEAWAHCHGKTRWGEKTPGNLFYSHLILSMFPDARFIHIVRDPRAVVHSMQRVSFFPTDIIFNALNLRKTLNEGRAIFQRDVPPSQRIVVRYEDLVHDPVPTIRRICSFADLEYEPGMLAFHEDAAQYMTEAASTSFNATATRPLSKDRVDAWTQQMTSEEVTLTEIVTREIMTEFGYNPNDHSLPVRRWPEFAAKYSYWHVHRWRNRHIRQYVLQHDMFVGLRHRLRRWSAPLRRRLSHAFGL